MGIIKKSESWFTVPDNEPYHFNFTKAIIAILTFIAIGGIIFCLSSCSQAKKIGRAYEYAANTNPVTAKDSLNGIKIGKKLIPKEKPKIIPGKTIRVPYPVLKKVPDEKAIAKLADSFHNAMLQEANVIAQDCLDDVTRERNTAYKKGLNDGYAKVLARMSTDSFETQAPDTVFLTDHESSLDLTDCEIKLRQSQASLIASQAKLGTFKWLFWILLGLVLVGGAFGIKKLLSPAKLLK